MKEMEWEDPTINKQEWGEGPWLNEPDKIQWQDPDTGLPCLINRGPLGALCGYVGVGRDHPWYGLDYYDACDAGNLDVHGGLTFAGKCLEHEEGQLTICHVVEEGEDDDVWWFGFDCGHAMDVTPGFEHRMKEIDAKIAEKYPTLAATTDHMFRRWYRDRDYVKQEVTKLAMQLHAANPQGEPT